MEGESSTRTAGHGKSKWKKKIGPKSKLTRSANLETKKYSEQGESKSGVDSTLGAHEKSIGKKQEFENLVTPCFVKLDANEVSKYLQDKQRHGNSVYQRESSLAVQEDVPTNQASVSTELTPHLEHPRRKRKSQTNIESVSPPNDDTPRKRKRGRPKKISDELMEESESKKGKPKNMDSEITLNESNTELVCKNNINSERKKGRPKKKSFESTETQVENVSSEIPIIESNTISIENGPLSNSNVTEFNSESPVSETCKVQTNSEISDTCKIQLNSENQSNCKSSILQEFIRDSPEIQNNSEIKPVPKNPIIQPTSEISIIPELSKNEDYSNAIELSSENPEPNTSITSPNPKNNSNSNVVELSSENPEPNTSITSPNPKIDNNSSAVEISSENPEPNTSITSPNPKIDNNSSAVEISSENPEPNTPITSPNPKIDNNSSAVEISSENPEPNTPITSPNPENDNNSNAVEFNSENPEPNTPVTSPNPENVNNSNVVEISSENPITSPSPKIEPNPETPKVNPSSSKPKTEAKNTKRSKVKLKLNKKNKTTHSPLLKKKKQKLDNEPILSEGSPLVEYTQFGLLSLHNMRPRSQVSYNITHRRKSKDNDDKPQPIVQKYKECKLCKNIYTCQNMLETHIKSHPENLCKLKSNNYINFYNNIDNVIGKEHMLIIKSEIKTESIIDSDNNSDFEGFTDAEINITTKNQSNKHSYVCVVCEKEFTCKNSIKLHIENHAKEIDIGKNDNYYIETINNVPINCFIDVNNVLKQENDNVNEIIDISAESCKDTPTIKNVKLAQKTDANLPHNSEIVESNVKLSIEIDNVSNIECNSSIDTESTDKVTSIIVISDCKKEMKIMSNLPSTSKTSQNSSVRIDGDATSICVSVPDSAVKHDSKSIKNNISNSPSAGTIGAKSSVNMDNKCGNTPTPEKLKTTKTIMNNSTTSIVDISSNPSANIDNNESIQNSSICDSNLQSTSIQSDSKTIENNVEITEANVEVISKNVDEKSSSDSIPIKNIAEIESVSETESQQLTKEKSNEKEVRNEYTLKPFEIRIVKLEDTPEIRFVQTEEIERKSRGRGKKKYKSANLVRTEETTNTVNTTSSSSSQVSPIASTSTSEPIPSTSQTQTNTKIVDENKCNEKKSINPSSGKIKPDFNYMPLPSKLKRESKPKIKLNVSLNAKNRYDELIDENKTVIPNKSPKSKRKQMLIHRNISNDYVKNLQDNFEKSLENKKPISPSNNDPHIKCHLCDTWLLKEHMQSHVTSVHLKSNFTLFTKPKKKPDLSKPIQNEMVSVFNSQNSKFINDVQENIDPINNCKFTCKICTLSFNVIEKLAEHLINIHNIHENDEFSDLLCDICNENFETEELLNEHVILIHDSIEHAKLACSHCSQCFDTEEQLDLHIINLHSVISMVPYQCLQCGQGFESQTLLDEHVESRHESNKILPLCKECYLCKRSSSIINVNCARYKSIEEREEEEEKEIEFDIEIPKIFKSCEHLQEFVLSNGLQDKMQYFHVYQCETCGTVLVGKEVYDEHLIKHKNELNKQYKQVVSNSKNKKKNYYKSQYRKNILKPKSPIKHKNTVKPIKKTIKKVDVDKNRVIQKYNCKACSHVPYNTQKGLAMHYVQRHRLEDPNMVTTKCQNCQAYVVINIETLTNDTLNLSDAYCSVCQDEIIEDIVDIEGFVVETEVEIGYTEVQNTVLTEEIVNTEVQTSIMTEEIVNTEIVHTEVLKHTEVLEHTEVLKHTEVLEHNEDWEMLIERSNAESSTNFQKPEEIVDKISKSEKIQGNVNISVQKPDKNITPNLNLKVSKMKIIKPKISSKKTEKMTVKTEKMTVKTKSNTVVKNQSSAIELKQTKDINVTVVIDSINKTEKIKPENKELTDDELESPPYEQLSLHSTPHKEEEEDKNDFSLVYSSEDDQTSIKKSPELPENLLKNKATNSVITKHIEVKSENQANIVETHNKNSEEISENNLPVKNYLENPVKFKSHYPCLCCDFISNSKKQLKEHSKTHKLCLACTLQFNSTARYQKHKQLHSINAITYYQCHCKQLISSFASLDSHILKFHSNDIATYYKNFQRNITPQIHDINAISCLYCINIFENEDDFQNHIQNWHYIENCTECSIPFYNNIEYNSPAVCTTCYEENTTEVAEPKTENSSCESDDDDVMITNEFLVEKELPKQIPTPKSSLLKNTIIQQNPASNMPQFTILKKLKKLPTNKPDVTFVCQKCYKKFKILTELNIHVEECKYEIFACTICNESFRNRCSIQLHLKIVHMKNKLIFRSKKDPISNKNVYECDTCNYSYSDEHMFLEHNSGRKYVKI